MDIVMLSSYFVSYNSDLLTFVQNSLALTTAVKEL